MDKFSNNFQYQTMPSPVGQLTLVASADALVAVVWENDREGRVPLKHLVYNPGSEILSMAVEQIGEYFAGARRVFDVPIELIGTDFQKDVWQALRTIPYGETRTYMQLAEQLDNPKAVRAVGAANGRNPISIIVPCHRVIGASGSLTGFAGGLEAKALLLDLELTSKLPSLA